MDITNIAPIFQLTCAFNFSYAVLHRNGSISTSLSSLFDVKDWINKIHKDETFKITKWLKEFRVGVEGSENESAKVKLRNKLEKHSKKLDSAKEKINLYDRYDEDFAHISLLLGSFGIDVILLTASESKDARIISLVCLMVLNLITIFFLIYLKKYIKIDSRMKYILTFFVCLAISFVGFVLHFWSKDCPFVIPPVYTTYIVLFSIFFSMSHFIIYYIAVLRSIFTLKYLTLKYNLDAKKYQFFSSDFKW